MMVAGDGATKKILDLTLLTRGTRVFGRRQGLQAVMISEHHIFYSSLLGHAQRRPFYYLSPVSSNL